MTTTQQTPTGDWTQRADGSWVPARSQSGSVAATFTTSTVIGGEDIDVVVGHGPPPLDLIPGVFYLDLDAYYGSSVGDSYGDLYTDTYGGGSGGTILVFPDMLSGHGVPSSAIGAEGDFYIDVDTYMLYGPKTSGAWGTGVSMIGSGGGGGDLDGGAPDTVYGGSDPIDGGTV